MFDLLRLLREFFAVVSGALTAYILYKKAKKAKQNGLPKGRNR